MVLKDVVDERAPCELKSTVNVVGTFFLNDANLGFLVINYTRLTILSNNNFHNN